MTLQFRRAQVSELALLARAKDQLNLCHLADDWLTLREALMHVVHAHATGCGACIESETVTVYSQFTSGGDPALREAFSVLGWPDPVFVKDAR